MTKEVILKKLVDLQSEVQQRFRAKLKGIFGSYVRGEQNNASDVDVLVEFEPGADLFDYVALSDFLEEKLNRRVDLVPIGSLREEIRADVLKEAIYL